MFTQTLLFKKFWKKKPKLILDCYVHMVKGPSYIKMPIFLIMLGTLNIWGRAKPQDCSSWHSLL
jgi:hypothetical protein